MITEEDDTEVIDGDLFKTFMKKAPNCLWLLDSEADKQTININAYHFTVVLDLRKNKEMGKLKLIDIKINDDSTSSIGYLLYLRRNVDLNRLINNSDGRTLYSLGRSFTPTEFQISDVKSIYRFLKEYTIQYWYTPKIDEDYLNDYSVYNDSTDGLFFIDGEFVVRDVGSNRNHVCFVRLRKRC